MTRMVSTETSARAESRATTWGSDLPRAIKRLECALTTAFHASDDVEGLSYEHRVRMYDDILVAIADAASLAAREGHAAWAMQVIDAAAERPPQWAAGYAEAFWERLLESGLDAVLSTIAA
ncbi:hypothetical protein [Frondihabitans australicus]|uniref:Uncharacterized protein n=1 Tax=Frondihabitans australicus TaxID=386892 RepID=A0A495IEY2_9MICO|nr:hypothetical protein [Frondihabitans australicus]RKR74557.1 hypothetical protein C8E83_1676 [Frondihabitans australicus]